MTGVPTSAALCSLTVASRIWEKDFLLQLVAKLASPLQLSVKIEKKGNSLMLSMGDKEVKQRNAILRALCGYGLHYALDQAPYYFMGGHSFSARSLGESTAAAAMGSLTMWMSISAQITEVSDEFLMGLNAHLECHSFLILSPQPTLADLDLVLVLLTLNTEVSCFSAVNRWFTTVVSVLNNCALKGGIALPFPPVSAHVSMPVFFYGSEDASVVLQPKQPPAQLPQDGKDQNIERKGAKKQGKTKEAKKEVKSTPEPAGNQAATEFDISAMDIRVGKIIRVWHHEEADKLFCEEIDLGTEKRQVASGLRPFYKKEDLQDRLVLVLCNLKARNLVGFPSHGMVLCASNSDHSAVEFVVPPTGSRIGERVQFEGFSGEPEPENKVAKKKIFEKLAPDLKTDADGIVVWKGKVGATTVGAVKSVNGMPDAQVS